MGELMNELLKDFLAEAAEHLNQVDSDLALLAAQPDNQAIIDNLFRMVHTIKGTCSFLGLSDLANVAHGSEDALSKIRSGKETATAEVVDQILASVDEIKVMLRGLEAEVDADGGPELLVATAGIVPHLRQLTQSLGDSLGKSIDLRIDGMCLEIERRVLDLLRTPLVHLIRNAADHGLEDPAERKAAGKPETGLITVAARIADDRLTVEVADDGRGLCLASIGRKAVERGLVTRHELETMSEDEIVRFVFVAGLSTAPKVTDLSGRGVGLDVVRAAIEGEGGRVSIYSKSGKGCSVVMTIPLVQGHYSILKA